MWYEHIWKMLIESKFRANDNDKCVFSRTNGLIFCVSTLILTTVSNASEAKYTTLFMNSKITINICETLTDVNCA